MRNKKLLMIMLILFVSIASTNVVSADWFGLDDSSQDSSVAFEGLLIDSEVNYQLHEIYTLKHVKNDNFEGTVSEKDNTTWNVTYDGYIKLNISADSSNSIKDFENYLKESNNDSFSFFTDLDSHSSEFVASDCDFILDGDILTVTFRGENTFDLDCYNESYGESGTFSLNYEDVDMNLNSTNWYINLLDKETFESL